MCEILEISVNELLSGERLADENYKKKAEENIVNLVNERHENKKKIWISVLVMIITLLGALTIIFMADFMYMKTLTRLLLIGIALVIIILGIAVACMLEREAGAYMCRKCKHRFVPTMSAYVAGVHSLTTRYLKCPKCGQKSFCKKVLNK